MIRKILIVVAILLPTLASAQIAVGGWKIHTSFTGVEDMCETKNYIYYVSGKYVYRIDKATNEVQSMNSANYLNDSDVTSVFADNNGQSVVVVYTTGNMDRIYDNGKIINISDVKDAQTLPSRNINDISFTTDKFYVATDFGIITYSSKKDEVLETAFTQFPVTSVAASSTFVAIYGNNNFYVAPVSQRIKKITDLKQLSSVGEQQNVESVVALGQNCLFFSKGGQLTRIMLDGEDYSGSQLLNLFDIDGTADKNVTGIYNSSVYKSSEQVGYCYNAGGLFKLDGNGTVSRVGSVNVERDRLYLFDSNLSLSSVWEGSGSGVREIDMSSSAPVEITGYVTGSGLLIDEIHSMSMSSSGKLYMNKLYQHSNIEAYDKTSYPSYVIALKDGNMENVTGMDVAIENKNNSGIKPPYAINKIFRVKPDPQDPDAYYVGTFFEGLYYIKGGKQEHKYFTTSAGFDMVENWACIVYDCDIDNYGNLWVYACGDKDDSIHRLFVLPAEKRNKATTEPSDWRSYALKGVVFDNWQASVLACRKSNMVVVLHGSQSRKIFVVDTKNTPSVSDDAVHIIDRQIDQDGKEWADSWGFNAAVEDQDGKIWIGTDIGVFEIPDIKNVSDGVVAIRRMKIPRNDGTNLADYLLDNVNVSAIAVDAANRKWISTVGSGVYLVSPTGDAVIEHFTTDNSILPSNKVYSVACDPNSNKVFFGTPFGLVEYSSTSSPAADSYDDVYAYPNPVRPDYGGWITVTGLMENSLVKIADAGGNVIHQGKSDGGMFVWDGCNGSGERVKTGVYFVLASQNATGNSEACVTKIMVVN